jgi:hypothetical protein
MSRTEHQMPLGRCRHGIGTEDDTLFVCPLTREMVQLSNLLWETQQRGEPRSGVIHRSRGTRCHLFLSSMTKTKSAN